MSPEEAVADRIMALNTSAGSRVWMLKLPQQPTLPAVRVQLVDDPEDYHLRGGSAHGRARVQVDAYAAEDSGADPYAVANALAEEINGDDAGSGLSGAYWDTGSPTFRITGAFRLDRSVDYDPDERRLVRVRQDFAVHYSTV